MATAHPDWEKAFPAGNGHRARQWDCFSDPFVHANSPVWLALGGYIMVVVYLITLAGNFL